jgi:hypothetical protein
MFNVWAHMTVMYKMRQSAKIDMRMTRQIMQRPAAQLAATIRRCAQDWIDFGRRFATRIPSSVAEVWFRAVAGAFLISICFLVSFIAADASMSRRPTSLQSICSNCWSFTGVATRSPTTRNGSKNLVACTMTARSRSTNPN